MTRLDLINYLAKCNDAKFYLEIGVDKGLVFNHVNIPYKVGVDPDKKSHATIHATSDNFFTVNKQYFDIIFIDGLHFADQVIRDVENSLSFLNSHGFIICHDMLPNREIIQRIPRETNEWTGDCWKAWVKLRCSRSDLSMYVVDTDYGCGIIQVGSQDTISVDDIDLTYDNFTKYKHKWMSIISIEELMIICQNKN